MVVGPSTPAHQLICPLMTHYVTVSNSASMPITVSSCTFLYMPLGYSFILKYVLHVPQLVRNLLFIHKLTRDNYCSIEFDPSGFSMKDL
jgi:hypothetical protein